ncbi:hypothetical protein B0H19DRAFT_1191917 [Mycena capillaripes]|nr:hypothetical protein B0H19DRAFT_1191917 [Mycena capillaripes]
MTVQSVRLFIFLSPAPNVLSTRTEIPDEFKDGDFCKEIPRLLHSGCSCSGSKYRAANSPNIRTASILLTQVLAVYLLHSSKFGGPADNFDIPGGNAVEISASWSLIRRWTPMLISRLHSLWRICSAGSISVD